MYLLGCLLSRLSSCNLRASGSAKTTGIAKDFVPTRTIAFFDQRLEDRVMSYRNLVFSLLLLVGCNDAEAEKKFDFSIQCSSLFFLMAQVDEEEMQPFASLMGKLSELMASLSQEFYSQRQNKSLTNGEFYALRNIEADRLVELFKTDSSQVAGIYARCDAYREKIAKILYGSDKSKIAERINELSLPTNFTLGSEKASVVENVLSLALGNLERLGINSISEFYKSRSESVKSLIKSE